MRRTPILRRVIAVAVVLLATTSCGGDRATGVAPVTAVGESLLPGLGGTSTPALLTCTPPTSTQSVTGLIGALGGTLSLGNTKIVIPQNAVLTPTSFTLTIPQSSHAEISIRAGDAEHYTFLLPVVVSIDYARCASSLNAFQAVSAWHIDESTKALLEQMPAVDVRLLHTITFTTGHLSGYAVAD